MCGIKSSGRLAALLLLVCFCSAYLPADVILTDEQAAQLRQNFERLNQIVNEQQARLIEQASSIETARQAIKKLEESLKTASESWTKLSNERDGWRTATLLTVAISGGILLGNWLLPQRVK